eukprot:COSAG06_NODE_3553_length_5196_cov_22.001570_3_plen_86_part_00
MSKTTFQALPLATLQVSEPKARPPLTNERICGQRLLRVHTRICTEVAQRFEFEQRTAASEAAHCCVHLLSLRTFRHVFAVCVCST